MPTLSQLKFPLEIATNSLQESDGLVWDLSSKIGMTLNRKTPLDASRLPRTLSFCAQLGCNVVTNAKFKLLLNPGAGIHLAVSQKLPI